MREPKIHSLRASPIGRRAEFADFYTSTYPAVAAEHLALTGNPDLAHAAVIAAYVRAWREWSAVRTLQRPVMWVRADAVRRIQRPRWVQRLAGQYPDKSAPLALDPEDELLVDALDRLLLAQRVPLVLHYVAQLSVPDIVDWFGGTVAEVDTLLDDGFEALVGLLDWPDDSWRDVGRHAEAHSSVGNAFDWTAGALEDAAHRFRRYVPTPPSTEVFRGARVKKVTRRGSVVTAAAVVGSVGLVVYFSPAPPPAAEAASLIPSGPADTPAVGGVAAPPVYRDTAIRPVAGTAKADPSTDAAAGAALEQSIATSTGSARATGGSTTTTPTTATTATTTTAATTSPAASTTTATATTTTTATTTAAATTTSTSTPVTTTSTSAPVTTTTTTGRHRAPEPGTTTATTTPTTTTVTTTPATTTPTSSSAPGTTTSTSDTSQTSDTSEPSSSVTETTRPPHGHGHTSTTTTAPAPDADVVVGGTTGGADAAPLDAAPLDTAPLDAAPAVASPTSTTVTIGEDRTPDRATGRVTTTVATGDALGG